MDNLTETDLDRIRQMSRRAAHETYGVSQRMWQRLKSDPAFVPESRAGRNRRRSIEITSVVLESVREAPHLNSVERAKVLKTGTSAVQKVLEGAGLRRLNARLEYAGYRVEVCRPLAIARQRRIVALYPGALTHIDYKTFGRLRGAKHEETTRFGGYAVIDSFTGFAHVEISLSTSSQAAVRAVSRYCAKAPFTVRGVMLSDNGSDFLSDEFETFLARSGLLHRTTRFNHPWSNGKVEALNRTLKYQCLPAVAGNARSIDELAAAVEVWMDYYNAQRAHNGHINRGLPPLALHALWLETPGTFADRLVKMGIVSPGDEWTMRRMGEGTSRTGNGLDVAVVLDRKPKGEFIPQDPLPAQGTLFMPAK